jgi:hypothetical protein
LGRGAPPSFHSTQGDKAISDGGPTKAERPTGNNAAASDITDSPPGPRFATADRGATVSPAAGEPASGPARPEAPAPAAPPAASFNALVVEPLRAVAAAFLIPGPATTTIPAARSAGVFLPGGAAVDAQTNAPHGFASRPGAGPAGPGAQNPTDRDTKPEGAGAPAGVPWLAELLQPTGWGAAQLLLAPQQFLPWHEQGDQPLAAKLTSLLHSPWLPGTVAALVALEVARRQAARRSSAATDFPEITGPRGL